MAAQNPFDVHQRLMQEYMGMISPPVNNANGNTVTLNNGDDKGEQTFPAVVGVFMIQPVMRPDGGGVSPGLSAEVILQKNDAPGVTRFLLGQKITATQVGGSRRNCQIWQVEDTFTEWRLQVWDASQGA